MGKPSWPTVSVADQTTLLISLPATVSLAALVSGPSANPSRSSKPTLTLKVLPTSDSVG